MAQLVFLGGVLPQVLDSFFAASPPSATAASPELNLVETCVNVGLLLFGLRILAAVAASPRMLLGRHGRAHRVLGALMALQLTLGLADARGFRLLHGPTERFVFDFSLSALGFAVSLSAALEFGGTPVHTRGSAQHATVASGILDEGSTVSRDEMLEHCFYQLLNLAQITYLHLACAPTLALSLAPRVLLAWLLTLPWLARGRFPVNSFSANYDRPGVGGTTPLIRLLYRLKKWQYLLYKHCLLVGLSVSVALDGGGAGEGLVATPHFRTYWLCINTAYVFEFFMQTLVKRRYGTLTARRASLLGEVGYGLARVQVHGPALDAAAAAAAHGRLHRGRGAGAAPRALPARGRLLRAQHAAPEARRGARHHHAAARLGDPSVRGAARGRVARAADGQRAGHPRRIAEASGPPPPGIAV
jgi:hypothetical protein